MCLMLASALHAIAVGQPAAGARADGVRRHDRVGAGEALEPRHHAGHRPGHRRRLLPRAARRRVVGTQRRRRLDPALDPAVAARLMTAERPRCRLTRSTSPSSGGAPPGTPPALPEGDPNTMSEPRRVTAPQLPAPVGPYSPGVAFERLVFVSGQGATDPATGALAGHRHRDADGAVPAQRPGHPRGRRLGPAPRAAVRRVPDRHGGVPEDERGLRADVRRPPARAHDHPGRGAAALDGLARRDRRRRLHPAEGAVRSAAAAGRPAAAPVASPAPDVCRFSHADATSSGTRVHPAHDQSHRWPFILLDVAADYGAGDSSAAGRSPLPRPIDAERARLPSRAGHIHDRTPQCCDRGPPRRRTRRPPRSSNRCRRRVYGSMGWTAEDCQWREWLGQQQVIPARLQQMSVTLTGPEFERYRKELLAGLARDEAAPRPTRYERPHQVLDPARPAGGDRARRRVAGHRGRPRGRWSARCRPGCSSPRCCSCPAPTTSWWSWTAAC